MTDEKVFRAYKRRINDEMRVEKNYVRGYISYRDMESRKERINRVFNHKYDLSMNIK